MKNRTAEATGIEVTASPDKEFNVVLTMRQLNTVLAVVKQSSFKGDEAHGVAALLDALHVPILNDAHGADPARANSDENQNGEDQSSKPPAQTIGRRDGRHDRSRGG